MKLFAFGLSAVAALALSAGTASAQYPGHSHTSRPVVVSPGYSPGPVVSPGYGGGYLPPAPNYGTGYTPGFGGGTGGGRFYSPIPRGHSDYVPGHLDPHRGHYDYKPGHFDRHTPYTPRPRH